MKAAVNRANNPIGHRISRNPDFHATTSTSANRAVHYMSSVTNLCDGGQYWKTCADAYPDQTFRLWLASNHCWTDGTNNTCRGVLRRRDRGGEPDVAAIGAVATIKPPVLLPARPPSSCRFCCQQHIRGSGVDWLGGHRSDAPLTATGPSW